LNDQLEKDKQTIDAELKISDKLAYERTMLAQERTLMATIRTSVSLISFGFTIAKFFQELRKGNMIPEGSTLSTSNLGLWLIIIGTGYVILSTIQHVLILKSLRVPGVDKRISFTFILAVVISLLGLALIISFYTNILSLDLHH